MSTLLKAFDFNEETDLNKEITDYEIFKDKDLLDSLRTKILLKLVDTDTSLSESMNTYINNQIESSIEGYDLSPLERGHLFNLIENELGGYGPITSLINNPEISEIMVNGPSEIYIEINGKIIKDESVSFINNDHIIRTIQRIIEPVGRTIDIKNPFVDARLKDGSRINAIIPPLSVKGPVLTVRKFRKSVNDLDDLLRIGTITPYMAKFLDASVKAKLNILICGGSGSGKTTLLNILGQAIPEDERIITIEDAAELKLHQNHVISLETRNNNYEDNGKITVRDLVINSLRMRPDRIIVGEVRGKEAFDMLQAMNTGHEGSITTLHANNNKDALNRLESMVLMSEIDLPIDAIREYIVNTIDLIVHIERLSDGKRKILEISEISNINNGVIILNDIFSFKINGITSNKEVDGEFIMYNTVPKCLNKFHMKGITEIDFMFYQ